MMLGLGLTIANVAVLQRRGGAPASVFTSLGIIGDSITKNNEPDSNLDATGKVVAPSVNTGFAQRLVNTMPAGTTAYKRAYNSRVAIRKGTDGSTGNPIYYADGSSDDLPVASLASFLSLDAATGAQLLWSQIGTNDVGANTALTFRTDMAVYYGRIQAKGLKFCWAMFPPPSTADTGGVYANIKVQRQALLDYGIRDPAKWGLFADYYDPAGEHPDLNAADNSMYFGEDNLHPVQAGQDKLYEAKEQVRKTLVDVTRVSSTQMYSAQWPGNRAGLATETATVSRFIVGGLAHKGIALTGGNALSATGGAEVRVGNGAWAASQTGWLYNGDVVELRMTTSATANTGVSTDLKVGGETRTITFTTAAAVTPASYAHGGISAQNTGGSVHDHTIDFPAAGQYLLHVGLSAPFVPDGVTYDPAGAGNPTGANVAATKPTHSLGNGSDGIAVYLLSVPAAGSKVVRIALPGGFPVSLLGWTRILNADPVPIQVSPAAPGNAPSNEPNPHLTEVFGAISVGGFVIGASLVNEGASGTTTGTTAAGTTLVDFQSTVNAGQGVRLGMVIGARGSGNDVTLAFNTQFGNRGRVGTAFKALGS